MKRFAPNREILRSPLARRLIVAIVLVSSAITLCLTALQIYGEYRGELESIHSVFRQIEEVHLESLSQSLWATNEHDLQLQLEGIVRGRNLEYAAVREGGRLWAQAGRRVFRNVIERQYPMTHEYRGQTLQIGTLTVVAGLDAVYGELMNRAIIILAGNALKTFLVAGFAFVFIHRLVNRRLLSVAEFLRGFDLRGRASSLLLARTTGRRPDELDEVITAINLMHANARSMLAALHASESRLRLAVESSHIGLWDWDVQTKEVHFSPEWKRQIGYGDDELAGRFEEWESRVHPEDLPAALAKFQACLNDHESRYKYEYRLRHKDGSYRWIYSSGQLVRDHSGPVRFLGCHLDITERKQAEEALRESEERYRRMVELSPDAITIHEDGRWVFANSAAARILGVQEPAQLVGRSALDFMHPDVHQQVKARWKQLYEDKQPVDVTELKMMRPDGTIRYLETRAVPVVWQGRAAAQVVARDVTERKRAVEALRSYAERLKGMSRRLMTVEETERRNINRELHDRIGQNLSALNLSLNLIRAGLSTDSLHAVGARLDAAQKLLETATAQVRNVMAELHPPALEDYGLLAALRTYAESLSAEVNISVAVNGEDLLPRPSPVEEMALFRIAQGALANAAAHARAKHIDVTLAATPGKATLTIADDGVGFDTAHTAAAHANWGLTIMRERAEAIGAALRIDSSPGSGTRVVVEVVREPS